MLRRRGKKLARISLRRVGRLTKATLKTFRPFNRPILNNLLALSLRRDLKFACLSKRSEIFIRIAGFLGVPLRVGHQSILRSLELEGAERPECRCRNQSFSWFHYSASIGDYDWALPNPACDVPTERILEEGPIRLGDSRYPIREDLEVASAAGGLSPILRARLIKWDPWLFAYESDFAVWMDGNVASVACLETLLSNFRSSGADIGLVRHPIRSNVWEEFDACEKLRKASTPLLRSQRLHFEKFPVEPSLWETNFMVVNLRSELCQRALGELRLRLKEWSLRDQLLLPFIVKAHQLSVHELDISPRGVVADDRFVKVPHKGQKK